MATRPRSPSVEFVSITRLRSPSVELLAVIPPPAAGAKRKTADEPAVGTTSKRTKTAPPVQAYGEEENPDDDDGEDVENDVEDDPERWKWIDRTNPEIELKGIRIAAHNCGGTFFKSSAKNVGDRLDKLEAFFDECGGDETCHRTYGRPELYKPKRVSANKEKQNADAKRWHWINRSRPEILLRDGQLEAYNCGGCYFSTGGGSVAELLDEMENFLAECDGDETCHPDYGMM